MTGRHDHPALDFEHNPSFAGLFDSLREGVIIWDAGKVLRYANTAAREITTLPLVHGTPLQPAPVTVGVLDGNSRPAQSRTMPVYRAFEGEDVQPEDMRFITRDGTHKYLSVSARRVLHADGSLAYVITTMRDISTRKSRESKLQFMVDSAKILSLTLDFEQRLIEKARLTVPRLADWCSMSVLQHDGTLKRVAVIHEDAEKIAFLDEFEKRHPTDGMVDLIRQQTPLLIKVVTDDVLKDLATSTEHLEGLRVLGLKSLIVIPIASRGEGVGAMTLAYAESGRTYDESDLEFFQEFCNHVSVVFDNARLFEEIETRDKSKDIFLAALSHELRNPLAPIKSSLELLKMRETAEDVREELDIIEHQFDHMARLLNDLLDVTRFTQDRISLSAHPVELRKLTERALKSADALVRNADITLNFSYPSAPLSVIADETRLEQAISNLLSNALKFTPAGGSIWVELEHAEHDAVIRVRDNGAGIDASDLPRIFDMYYQGVRGGSVNSGLGIGLLLVQRIVALHQGSVAATSDGPGKGSEFVIRIPLAEVALPEEQTNTPGSAAHHLRILVVDDNAPAADALVRLLNKLGSNARAVYSGHEALGQEHLHEIDLFLLDVGMPHMDGYELVRALRDRGISAPIVALTGYGLLEDKKRAVDAGFTSHLTKPVGVRELNEMFEAVLTVTT